SSRLSSGSWCRSRITGRAPAWAKRCTSARPMPEQPPVTSTTLRSNTLLAKTLRYMARRLCCWLASSIAKRAPGAGGSRFIGHRAHRSAPCPTHWCPRTALATLRGRVRCTQGFTLHRATVHTATRRVRRVGGQGQRWPSYVGGCGVRRVAHARPSHLHTAARRVRRVGGQGQRWPPYMGCGVRTVVHASPTHRAHRRRAPPAPSGGQRKP